MATTNPKQAGSPHVPQSFALKVVIAASITGASIILAVFLPYLAILTWLGG